MKTNKLFFLFCILLSMLATNASAYDFEVKNADGVIIYYNYINNKTEAEVTYEEPDEAGYSGSIAIPKEVTYKKKTLKVTSIGDNAFANCSSLQSVTIPNSVKRIGEGAFYFCENLQSVTIPNSVKSIGNDAFLGCRSFQSVTIPNSVTSIGDNAFQGCSGLTSVTIPNSVKSIGNGVFWECSSLESVTIPNSVKSIGYIAFWECSSLESVTIPNSVTSIDEHAFDGCSSLQSVTIPNSVTSIREGIFKGCSKLSSITIPNSVTSIGNNAFEECSSLKTITIPNSVTSIGTSAFEYSGLTSVTIPNNVTSIAYYAFRGCSSLTSITIPNSVTSIGNLAFGDCSSLKSVTIPNSVTSIGNNAFDNSGLTSITIPNSVTSIGNYAFDGCKSLVSVTIPNSVTSLGRGAFDRCYNLKKVTSKIKKPFAIIYTFTDETYSKATLYVPKGTAAKYWATDGWKYFRYIVEDDSATGIDDVEAYDFAEKNADDVMIYYNYVNNKTEACVTNKTDSYNDYSGSVVIPKEVIYNNKTLKVTSIGKYAFSGCSSLASVTIPNSVTGIEERAFANCKNLEKVNSKIATPFAISDETFDSDTYSNATLYVPKGTVAQYKATDGWKNFKNIVEDDSATAINDVEADNTLNTANVIYDTNGKRLTVTSLDELPSGLYIINGKKVVK